VLRGGQAVEVGGVAGFDLPGNVENRRVVDNFVDEQLLAGLGRAVDGLQDRVTGLRQRRGVVVLANDVVRLGVRLEKQPAAIGQRHEAVERIERDDQRAQLQRDDVQAQLLADERQRQRFGGRWVVKLEPLDFFENVDGHMVKPLTPDFVGPSPTQAGRGCPTEP